MQITEIRIKLMDEAGERLQAFCSITFDDCFVIRDLKIIEGTNGPFVAMPSRKLTSHCLQCGSKNHLRANFCNECGAKLNELRQYGPHNHHSSHRGSTGGTGDVTGCLRSTVQFSSKI